MQLLVSVRDEIEAEAAVAGGADIIDAKEPLAGALGAVSCEVLRAIVAAVRGARPVTAALGDAADDHTVERDARAFVAAGATLVKIGFAGVMSGPLVRSSYRAGRLYRQAMDARNGATPTTALA